MLPKIKFFPHCLKSLSACVSFLACGACSPLGSADPAELRPVEVAENPENMKISLSRLDQLNADLGSRGVPPISYQVLRKSFAPERSPSRTLSSDSVRIELDALEGASSEHSSHLLEVQLGLLTRDQYESVRAAYKSVAPVEYDPARSYLLTDFLAPVIQALEGLRFVKQSEKHAALSRIPAGLALDPTVRVASNCWTTAYEVARNPTDRVELFYVEGVDIERVLRDDIFGSDVKTLEGAALIDPAAAGAAERNSGLEPGDMLLLYVSPYPGVWELAHAATFIDDDLYFEKTGPKSPYAYRLVSYRDLVSAMPIYGRDNGFTKTRLHFRRFNGKPLPAPSQAFSLTGLERVPGQFRWAISSGVPEDLRSSLALAVQGPMTSPMAYLYRILPVSLVRERGRYTVADEAFEVLQPLQARQEPR